MRDIGRRIQRYRLSRYRPPQAGWPRPPRWVWLAAALWLVYIGILSDRSLYRIWRMSEENARAQHDLRETQKEIDRLNRAARQPNARRDEAERTLRGDGFARRGELIYRIESGAPDTLGR